MSAIRSAFSTPPHYPGIALWQPPFEQILQNYLQTNRHADFSKLNHRLQFASPTDIAFFMEKAKSIYRAMQEDDAPLTPQEYIILGKAAQLNLCTDFIAEDAVGFFQLAQLKNNPVAHFELAKIHNNSVSLLTMAADENVGDAYLLLGQLHLRQNEKDKALALFQMAGHCGCPEGYWLRFQHAVDKAPEGYFFREKAEDAGCLQALCRLAISTKSIEMADVLIPHLIAGAKLQQDPYVYLLTAMGQVIPAILSKRVVIEFLQGFVEQMYKQHLANLHKKENIFLLNKIKDLPIDFFSITLKLLPALYGVEKIKFAFHLMMIAQCCVLACEKELSGLPAKFGVYPSESRDFWSRMNYLHRMAWDSEKWASFNVFAGLVKEWGTFSVFADRIREWGSYNAAYTLMNLIDQHPDQFVEELMESTEDLEQFDFVLTTLEENFKLLIAAGIKYGDLPRKDTKMANVILTTQIRGMVDDFAEISAAKLETFNRAHREKIDKCCLDIMRFSDDFNAKWNPAWNDFFIELRNCVPVEIDADLIAIASEVNPLQFIANRFNNKFHNQIQMALLGKLLTSFSVDVISIVFSYLIRSSGSMDAAPRFFSRRMDVGRASVARAKPEPKRRLSIK